MANMGYCRFENTYKDLRDCYEHMDETDLSETESKYREKILALCKEITEQYDW